MNRECILSLLSITSCAICFFTSLILTEIFLAGNRNLIFLFRHNDELWYVFLFMNRFSCFAVLSLLFFPHFRHGYCQGLFDGWHWPEHKLSLRFRQISAQINPQMFAITKLRAIIFLWIPNARGFPPFSRKTVFIPAWCCFHLAVKLFLLQYIYFLLLCDVYIYSAMFQPV